VALVRCRTSTEADESEANHYFSMLDSVFDRSAIHHIIAETRVPDVAALLEPPSISATPSSTSSYPSSISSQSASIPAPHAPIVDRHFLRRIPPRVGLLAPSTCLDTPPTYPACYVVDTDTITLDRDFSFEANQAVVPSSQLRSALVAWCLETGRCMTRL
jgi:hypothetical protein